jgi:cytochrome c oxidase subunit 2
MDPARSVAATAASATAPKAQFAALRNFKQNEYGFSETWSEHPAVAPLDSWRQLKNPPANEDPALVAQGRKLFVQKTCSSCHSIRGHEAFGQTAPDLTHVGSRSTIAAGLLENNAEQLRRWIHNPVAVKPGNKMYYGIGTDEHGMGGMAGYMKRLEKNGPLVPNIQLTAEDEVALVAYLQSLR